MSQTPRRNFLYLVGLCLACIIGYFYGMVNNSHIRAKEYYIQMSKTRHIAENVSRHFQSYLVDKSMPLACDDDNCMAVPAEEIKISTHVPVTSPNNDKDTEKDNQANRKRTIQKICYENKELWSEKLTYKQLKQLYVNEKLGVIYCSIPKAGCTNWKRILLALTNSSLDIKSITVDYAHHNDILQTLYNYPKVERDQMLKSYTKFMFVRNPFIRLLSAYKDKFESLWRYRDDPNGVYFRRYAAEILSKYRANATEEQLATGENVTWTEFVQYVTHLDRKSFNQHWMPMYELCSPCHIEYDFIGRMEYIDIEAKRLLTSLNVNGGPDSFPHAFSVHATNSTTVTYKTYGDITVHQLRRLWDIYKFDFQMFGYPKPDFV